MTWIDSVRAARAAGLSRSARPAASNAQAQACSSGFFQPGDDPSHPFRIGPGHPPAKPQDELSPRRAEMRVGGS